MRMRFVLPLRLMLEAATAHPSEAHRDRNVIARERPRDQSNSTVAKMPTSVKPILAYVARAIVL